VDFARHHSHDQLGVLLRACQQHHGRKMLRTMLSHHGPEVTITATSPDQTWSWGGPHASHGAAGAAGALDLPARLVDALLELEGIPRDMTCAQLTSHHMHGLIQRLKLARFAVTGTRGFKEAMVTAGGIALPEVDPHTLASKRVPGLYVTGEVLDLTGPSGGYNLQLAFSTGHLAGTSAAALLSRAGAEP
jgi:hypothetical protein